MWQVGCTTSKYATYAAEFRARVARLTAPVDGQSPSGMHYATAQMELPRVAHGVATALTVVPLYNMHA